MWTQQSSLNLFVGTNGWNHGTDFLWKPWFIQKLKILCHVPLIKQERSEVSERAIILEQNCSANKPTETCSFSITQNMNFWFKYLCLRSLAKGRETALNSMFLVWHGISRLPEIHKQTEIFLSESRAQSCLEPNEWPDGLQWWSHIERWQCPNRCPAVTSLPFLTPASALLATKLTQCALTQFVARSVPQPSSLHSNRRSCQPQVLAPWLERGQSTRVTEGKKK